MSTQSIPRVAAGVPTGGQFAPSTHEPADLELSGPTALPAWDADEKLPQVPLAELHPDTPVYVDHPEVQAGAVATR